MFNKPKMKIRSTTLDLITEPFLLVLFKHLLCSRCGQFSITLATKHGKNELKLFLRGFFYFQNLIATITKAIPAKAPITLTGVGIEEREPLTNCKYSFGTVRNSWYETLEGAPSLNTECGAMRILIPLPSGEPSTTCPTVNDFCIIPTAPPTVTVAENGLMNLYCTILNKIGCDKYTDLFFTVRWQKSFNSFLLPLKFIWRGKVAMEHNVSGLCDAHDLKNKSSIKQ